MKWLSGLLLIFWLAGSGWAASYYVDATSGNDSYTGLAGTYDGVDGPWKTIAKVNSVSFAAGDIISFKRGEIWREMLVVPTSGTSGNPIVYGAYGTGDKPIIMPSKRFAAGTTWSGPDGNGEYYLLIGNTTDFAGPGTNAYRGQPTGISTYTNLSIGVKGSLAEDQWVVYADGTDVYVYYKPVSGHTPTEYDWDFAYSKIGGVWTCAVLINGKSYVTLDNLQTMHGGSGTYHASIYITTGADYVIVRDCDVVNAHFIGVSVTGSDHVTVSGGSITGCRDCGVWTGTGTDYLAVTDCTIIDNSRFSATADVVYDRGGICFNEASTHCSAERCTIGNNGTATADNLNSEILLDGTDYATINRNYIYNSWARAIGMSATAPGTHHTITNNIINDWNLGGRAYSYNAAIFLTGIGTPVGTGTHLIANNTLYASRDTDIYGINLAAATGTRSDGVTIINNVLYCLSSQSTARCIRLGTGTYITNLVCDNNLVYGCTNKYEYWGTTYTTPALFYAASGYGQHDKATSPGFTNPSGAYNNAGDFRITGSSPAFNAGTDPGATVTQDYWGHTRRFSTPDIGASELIAIIPARRRR